jgi:dipeptidyl aminopeptidase/acylaminoacyl peptidase
MRPRRIGLLLAACSLAASSAPAADGDLLAKEPVPLEVESLSAGKNGPPPPAVVSRLAELAGSIELFRITYESEGLKVRGYLALPKQGEKLPCVIYNRGGNREFGALSDPGAAWMLGPLAARGYAVVASQYRGNAGGEGREEFGGSEVRDVLSLIPLLEALPRADASRIGMFGWSRGGMMTYLALAQTDRIRAAVVGAGVADCFETVAARPEMEENVYSELVPRWKEEREKALAARSAVRWADRLPERTPLLLLHGTGDWRVSPKQSLAMAERLLDARRPFRLMMFEGGDHGLSEFEAEVDAAVNSWLDRYVRDGESWPSLEPHGR